MFNGIEYKGSTMGYSQKYWLYQVEYEDGNKEELYHNEIHTHNKNNYVFD